MVRAMIHSHNIKYFHDRLLQQDPGSLLPSPLQQLTVMICMEFFPTYLPRRVLASMKKLQTPGLCPFILREMGKLVIRRSLSLFIRHHHNQLSIQHMRVTVGFSGIVRIISDGVHEESFTSFSVSLDGKGAPGIPEIETLTSNLYRPPLSSNR